MRDNDAPQDQTTHMRRLVNSYNRIEVYTFLKGGNSAQSPRIGLFRDIPKTLPE